VFSYLQDFGIKFGNAFLNSPIIAISPAHLIPPYFTISTAFEAYKQRNSSLRSFLQPLVTYFIGPSILRTFSHSSTCCSFRATDRVSHLYKTELNDSMQCISLIRVTFSLKRKPLKPMYIQKDTGRREGRSQFEVARMFCCE
jgi:hypothetical protein